VKSHGIFLASSSQQATHLQFPHLFKLVADKLGDHGLMDHFGKTGTLGNQADSQVVSIGGLFSNPGLHRGQGGENGQIENEAVALAQEKEVKRM
jgi:hypothetical protein